MESTGQHRMIERLFAGLSIERRKSKEMSLLVVAASALFFIIVLAVGGILWAIQQ